MQMRMQGEWPCPKSCKSYLHLSCLLLIFGLPPSMMNFWLLLHLLIRPPLTVWCVLQVGVDRLLFCSIGIGILHSWGLHFCCTIIHICVIHEYSREFGNIDRGMRYLCDDIGCSSLWNINFCKRGVGVCKPVCLCHLSYHACVVWVSPILLKSSLEV